MAFKNAFLQFDVLINYCAYFSESTHFATFNFFHVLPSFPRFTRFSAFTLFFRVLPPFFPCYPYVRVLPLSAFHPFSASVIPPLCFRVLPLTYYIDEDWQIPNVNIFRAILIFNIREFQLIVILFQVMKL